jgi:large subunit ribosomal protein L21
MMTGEARGKGASSDMFAVVETGGKQYKVSPGQTVEVEKLPAEPGDTVELGRVLLISTDDDTFVGTPLVEDAKVVARVAPMRRGPKLIVFRYKSKARYRRKTGHRQDYSVLTIEDIWANGVSLLPVVEEAEVEPEEEETVTIEEAEETVEAEEEDVTETETETEEVVSAAETEVTEVEAEVTEVEEAEAAPQPAPEPKRRRRAPKADKGE